LECLINPKLSNWVLDGNKPVVVKMSRESRQLLIGALKFIVFILIVIIVPVILSFYIDTSAFEAEMGVCLVSWVIALALQWAIGKATEGWVNAPNEARLYSGPPPAAYGPAPQGYGQPPPGYAGQYQQPIAAPAYGSAPRSHGNDSFGTPVNEPNIWTGPGPVYYQPGVGAKPQGVFQDHVCNRCGGPVDLTTKKCQMCGSRN
jgi:hypothetical protein